MRQTGDAGDPASPRQPDPEGPNPELPIDEPPIDEPPRGPPPRPVLFVGDMPLILRRVGAWLIDFTITFFVVFVAASMAGGAPAPDTEAEAASTELVVWIVAVPFVYRWAMQSAFGFTLGKLGMGLRLVDHDGQPPGPIVVLNREAVQLVLLYAWQVVPPGRPRRCRSCRALLILVPDTMFCTTFGSHPGRARDAAPAAGRTVLVPPGVGAPDAQRPAGLPGELAPYREPAKARVRWLPFIGTSCLGFRD